MNQFYRIVGTLFLMGVVLNTWAQQLPSVSGTVSNEVGEGIAGVTVTARTTGQSVASGSDGRYAIAAAAADTLVFSALGYTATEVAVGGRTAIDVVLSTSSAAIDEVVVVGYGTQSRAKLLGSVATVTSDKLADRPVTNASSALSGLAAGVRVSQGSGRPGADGATIRVRGVGTMNDASALIVVDGIPGGVLDAINPSDIESISILKDASSAAIYGAQAANGVILVTTKKGNFNQRATITYSGIFSRTNPSAMPTFVTDYVTHMELFNEGALNVGVSPVYQQSTIDTWKAANASPNALAPSGVPNHIAYPNTDWGQEIYNNYWLQNHNISVTGGAQNTKYALSARVIDNPGIMHNTGLSRYEMRANVDVKVTDFLTVGTQTSALTQNQDRGNVGNLYNFLRQTTPGLYPYYNGQFGGAVAPDESSQLNNLLLYLHGEDGRNQTSRFNSTIFANFRILEGLTFETRVNYHTRFQEQTAFARPLGRYNFANGAVVAEPEVPANMGTSQSFNKNYTLTFDNVVRYSNTTGKHSYGALVGHNEFYYNYYTFSASKRGLIDESINNIGSATEMISIGGGEEDHSMRSFFGRLNYDYDERYLVEFSLRRDGSSKFGLDRQYGTFPSVGLGWVLSKESFMQSVDPYFQDIKLRASWGKLGNDRTNFYAWHGVFGNVDYSFGGSQVGGVQLSRFGNNLLKWEESENQELGLEFTTLGRRAYIEANYYDRKTNGILATAQGYLTGGTTSPPIVNMYAMQNRGIEFNASWKDNIGALNYSIGGNFAYNKTLVTKYNGQLERGWVSNADGTESYVSNLGDVSTGGNNRVLEGHIYNEYFLRRPYHGDGTYFNADGSVNIHGGPTTGMIRTDTDLSWVHAMREAGYVFSPVNGVSQSQLHYGDFIYADLNGDGIYGNSTHDLAFTGTSNIPKYIYGFNLGLEYKGFDVQMLWSGEGGFQYYWNAEGYNNSIVRRGNHIASRVADNHYFYNPADPNDPRTNINGHFPRLKLDGDPINNVGNTFWLYDADFLKLRNLQVGYTLNNAFTKRLKLQQVRVYFSGENLLMFTKFPGLDPEIGAGAGYPTMRQYAFGINFGF